MATTAARSPALQPHLSLRWQAQLVWSLHRANASEKEYGTLLMDGCLTVRGETRTQLVYDCKRLCTVLSSLRRKRGSIKPEHKPAFCPGSQRRHASNHSCSSGLRDIDGVTELYRSTPGVLAPCFADTDKVLSREPGYLKPSPQRAPVRQRTRPARTGCPHLGHRPTAGRPASEFWDTFRKRWEALTESYTATRHHAAEVEACFDG